ncbi:hypothetical protein DID88_002516 [Monilinia fructigena]|uniref:Uncharacterized protein n=1 Tax=Monilinia fructigena TaxID=38457 RepID=A0A395IR04_9HELO|nr:hypothetical protein DID88_002516 [Monilinia fructigena]
MSAIPFNSIHGTDSGPLPPGTGMAFPGSPFLPMVYPPPQHAYADPFGNVGYGPPGFAAPHYQFPGTHPAPPPVNNSGMPGVNVKNQFGGCGIPPGYNYLFPPSHCLIHVFQTGSTPPWQARSPLYSYDAVNHKKFFVPTNMSVKDMMVQLGCDNKDPNKNVMTEVIEAGNGKWSKNMIFKGGDKDRMKMSLKDLGWEMERKRTGFPGQGPLVWVYITKD